MEPYVVRWNGGRFTREGAVGPSNADLLGVSCAAGECVSVGATQTEQVKAAFAEVSG
jgi:hypothetical protein